MSEGCLAVPRDTLYRLERDAAHVTNELEELIDALPSKFRKRVRGLSRETAHMYDDISHIKGLHWIARRRNEFAD